MRGFVVNQSSSGPNGPTVHPSRVASALVTAAIKNRLTAQRANRSTRDKPFSDHSPLQFRERSARWALSVLLGLIFPGPKRPWLGERLALLDRNTKMLNRVKGIAETMFIPPQRHSVFQYAVWSAADTPTAVNQAGKMTNTGPHSYMRNNRQTGCKRCQTIQIDIASRPQ